MAGDFSPTGLRVLREVGAVDVREDGMVVSLYVIVEYGTRVSEVANNLSNAVRYSVERTLGLPVVEVNVNVQGIHVSGAGGR